MTPLQAEKNRQQERRRSSVQFARLRKPTQADIEDVYLELLYTIRHQVGDTLYDVSDVNMTDYVRSAFTIDADVHKRIDLLAQKEKPPVVILNAIVLEARNLVAKDADGFSDPFCMLGIIPSAIVEQRLEMAEEKNSKGKNAPVSEAAASGKHFGGVFNRIGGSLSRRMSGKVNKHEPEPIVVASKIPLRPDVPDEDEIAAKLIRATSVQSNTLNPKWNERFQFIVDKPDSDKFHLDIWDHDDESSVVDAVRSLNEVNSLKGLGRYFKQVAQSARSNNEDAVDDFLGCVTVDVAEVAASARPVELWYPLQARSDRSQVQGELKLRLWLGTREDRAGHDDGDNTIDVRQHIHICKQFALHELAQQCGNEAQDGDKWTGKLSHTAEAVLHQHAVQGDLTELQLAMCRWVAFSWVYMERAIKARLLFTILDSLVTQWTPAALPKDQEELLAECFSHFLNHSYDSIVYHRSCFPPGNNTKSAKRLGVLLECLVLMHQSDLFHRLLPFQEKLDTEIASLIEVS